MLNAGLLLSIIIAMAGQSTFKKAYTEREGRRGTYFYSTVVSLAALLFFAVTGGVPAWEPGVLVYALVFGLAYTLGTVGGVLAVNYGPLSLTSLMISYSLMIPTVYGLVALHDPIRPGLFPGLALLAVSLIFINKKDPNASITPKWFFYTLLAFLGNGVCSVAQKMQQNAFNGAYKNEFMMISLVLVAVVTGALSLIRERGEVRVCARNALLWATLCGLLNGVVNLFVMILSARMSISVMFPLISAGGIITTYLIARFLYKEQLTRLQLAGLILGIGAVIFLNL